MGGQIARLAGPAFIANAAADFLTTPAAGFYHVIQHIQVVNKTGSAATFSFFLGATGGSTAGTEIGGGTKSVAANDTLDIYFSPGLVMENTKYLSAVSGTASALAATVMGEKRVSSA